MNDTRAQAGLTLMEMVVALGLFGIAAAIFGVGYKAMAKGTVEVGNTTDMQRVVKSMGTQLESDIRRAGFGLGGATAFSTLKDQEVSLHYKDLLGSSCAAGQVVSIRYSVHSNSLMREASCDGKGLPQRLEAAGKDSLAVRFRYLDNSGKATAASNQVRTVEYVVELTSGLKLHGDKKKRASAGSVSIVNNG